ncbi:MAG: hypothetical protein A2Y76_15570 [Planctomycetes bacterium RBG_13_60_9]|nr:MAG: hypothetical protein A2Y76_15570 [Planctomycetes bacterium RBG_13_60_9]
MIVAPQFLSRTEFATVRYWGLSKYLPEFGWTPVILTESSPGKSASRISVIEVPQPNDLLRFLKARFANQMARQGENACGGICGTGNRGGLATALRRFLWHTGLVPGASTGWGRSYCAAGRDAMSHTQVHAIISTSTFAHVVAGELKRKSGVPWIADFRDLWTQNHYYRAGAFAKSLERRFEVRTIRPADALITVSEPSAEELKDLHRGKPVFSIPNGFDPDEAVSSPLTGEFTITYAGRLYAGKRDPRPLLKALRTLIDEQVVDPRTISVRLFGPKQQWLEEEINHHRLGGIVSQRGTLPREVILQKERESQLLLLLNWDHPKEQGVYTGKLFEYLAARRPILAMGGPGGVVRELLNYTQAGTHVSDLCELKKVMTAYYGEYARTGSVPYRGLKERVWEYSHEAMAKRFAAVLNGVCSSAG